MNALTDERLIKCIESGESYSTIAKHFGTTSGAIAGRIYRLKRKQDIVIVMPIVKVGRKPNVKAAAVHRPYVPKIRAIAPIRKSSEERFFRPKVAEKTKNELRAELRQALENTSRM